MNTTIKALYFLMTFLVGYEVALYRITAEAFNKPVHTCVDTPKHEAFYLVKEDTPYCFLRNKQYPHRLQGGILIINEDNT